MSIKLLAKRPWPRITELASKHSGIVAVPYIGKGASKLLPLKAGSLLVTRLDETTVRQGQVHPGEILRLVRAGVEVHARNDLHAKVYVFGRRAVVGSANASGSSASLVEACVETTDAVAVAEAREFVRSLRSLPIGPEQIKRLIPLYPNEAPGRKRGAGEPAGSKVFVIPVHSDHWDDDQRAADMTGSRRAQSQLQDASTYRLERVPLSNREAATMARGDIILFRWSVGRGYQLEAPASFVHAEPYVAGAIVYAEVKKRQRDRSSTVVRAALGPAASKVFYPTSNVRQVRDQEAIQKCWRRPKIDQQTRVVPTEN